MKFTAQGSVAGQLGTLLKRYVTFLSLKISGNITYKNLLESL
jgi:hypothetical protein